MRVALISDIHGNLVALDAVLADIARQGVDVTVCLGDIALSGPRPGACIESVRLLEAPVVMGNCDQLVVDLRAEGVTPERERGYAKFHSWVLEIDLWSAQALSADDAAWLAALPMTARVELGPGATLLCAHGSPASYNQRLTLDMPEDALRAALDGIEREPGLAALASGHTHFAMVRALDGLTIVNPGSVGLPIIKDATGASRNPADYAEYAILTWKDGALSVEPHRVEVDEAAVRADAAASGMPHADRWRGDWLAG
jgi:predicted phosphodiesterase